MTYTYAFKITATLVLIHIPVFAGERLSNDHRIEIETIIENYILENPETIVKALDIFRENLIAKKEKNSNRIIAENLDNLIKLRAPSIGNPEGEIVVIEFVDYNCGYCKQVLPGLQNLVNKNEDLRIIFKDVPILGSSSLFAAKWALAAHKQGKYFEYHRELMNARGQTNNESVEKISIKLGLNLEQMKNQLTNYSL